MKEIYAHIISFDWQSAVLAYDFDMPGFAELDIINTGKTIKSVEATGNGRLYLEELPAETQICLRLRYPGGEQALSFTTLPAPQGTLINHFALIADPHISVKQENRKGRFFVESAAIGEDVVKRCAELGIKYTLWPGDITNEGYPEEYAIAAKVTITDIGMEIITIKVERGSCRNKNNSTAVRIIPVKILPHASSTDA